MQLSIFDVLGPVMIGPSSSHTAGTARLARVAAAICGHPFAKVRFGLSGSLARTGAGHGTYKALLAGALGFAADDERIRDAELYASQRGIEWEIVPEELEDMHENSAHITFYDKNGPLREVWGSSLGGGRVRITRIDSFDTDISGEAPTLVLRHNDRPGVLGDITGCLAAEGINIAVMRLSRSERGGTASAVIEVDGTIPEAAGDTLRALPHVKEVILLDLSQL